MLRPIRALREGRVLLSMLVVMIAGTAHGQTTAFTYQGQLSAAGALANGSYDLRFALFDSAGAQIGTNQIVPTVPVSAGVFTVQLDFGVDAFPGANRFLEIGVKPAGGGSFTTLAPRQQLTSTPYAIQTLNAQQLGGVPAGQYVKANDDGNVGIGTTTPQSVRLFINGGPGWTANGWLGSLGFQNAAAIGWGPNDSGQQFGIGQTNGGLYFFRTNSSFGTNTSPANYDMTISDLGELGISGNTTQARDKGGWVKALVHVRQDGTIARCYNSQNGLSTLGCGFGFSHTAGSGEYQIDFGFTVDDRFLSVTPANQVTVAAYFTAATKAGVFFTGNPISNDTQFDLVVY